MNLPPDVIDLLREFAAADVRYLLIGGHAVGFHAEPRFTKDIDLWIEDSPANVASSQNALRRFGAPKTTIDALVSANGLDVVWMGQPPLRIDLMKQVPGGDFAQAYAARVAQDLDGVALSVIGRADLIALKRASGRPQDLADIASLERLTTAVQP